jgi:hypothetical protein
MGPVTGLAHFYHLWADGDWVVPAREHFAALAGSGFSGRVHLGLVGQADARRHAAVRVRELWPGELSVCAEAGTGFEQVTLSRVRAFARSGRAEAVLYAHAKGAYHPEPVNDQWRRDMTARVVTGWRDCVALLGGYDAVGAHWLRPGTSSPDGTVTTDGPPFFAGNFWWATTAYLSGLAEPGTASRYEAEGWIGTDRPHVHDLAPGWPVYSV